MGQVKIDSANTLVFKDADDLKNWASKLQQPHWLARWTIGIEIPHPKTPIRQAIILTTGSEEELPWERQRALNHLFNWARETHGTHVDLPEYAGRSYLPEPDDVSWNQSDEKLKERGITVVRESIAWWPDNE